jgi:hypothetical protein
MIGIEEFLKKIKRLKGIFILTHPGQYPQCELPAYECEYAVM